MTDRLNPTPPVAMDEGGYSGAIDVFAIAGLVEYRIGC